MEVGNVSSDNGHISQTCCLSFPSDEGRWEQNCNTLIVSFITYLRSLTLTCRFWTRASSTISFRVNVEPLCRLVACSSETILLLGSLKALNTVSSQRLQNSTGSTKVPWWVWRTVRLCVVSAYNMHGAHPVMSCDGRFVPGDKWCESLMQLY